MSKNIFILSGSPRRGGNSDLLCDEFMRGALEAGNSVEKVFLRDKTVGFCTACYACRSSGTCVQQDDMAELLRKMHWADAIVMASPVYFYSIDGQMKTFIDRCLAQWTKISNKEFYFIMTAAENSGTVMDCTLECFRGFTACLPGGVDKGVIYGKGAYEKGEIKATPAFEKAYEMGKNA